MLSEIREVNLSYNERGELKIVSLLKSAMSFESQVPNPSTF